MKMILSSAKLFHCLITEMMPYYCTFHVKFI